MKRALVFILGFLSPACAGDVFRDAPNSAKVHEASGFVCPLKIGAFERDAAGQRNPQVHADYCAYSAVGGVYGSVILRPLPKAYDPKAVLASEFAVLEATGGDLIGETIQTLGRKDAPVSVYLRSYETARQESFHYRTLLASAAVGDWAVQTIVEYAEPRDKELQEAFLDAVYRAAQSKLATKLP